MMKDIMFEYLPRPTFAERMYGTVCLTCDYDANVGGDCKRCGYSNRGGTRHGSDFHNAVFDYIPGAAEIRAAKKLVETGERLDPLKIAEFHRVWRSDEEWSRARYVLSPARNGKIFVLPHHWRLESMLIREGFHGSGLTVGVTCFPQQNPTFYSGTHQLDMVRFIHAHGITVEPLVRFTKDAQTILSRGRKTEDMRVLAALSALLVQWGTLDPTDRTLFPGGHSLYSLARKYDTNRIVINALDHAMRLARDDRYVLDLVLGATHVLPGCLLRMVRSYLL